MNFHMTFKVLVLEMNRSLAVSFVLLLDFTCRPLLKYASEPLNGHYIYFDHFLGYNGTSKDLGGKFEIKLGNAGIIHATGYLTVKSHVGIQCFIVNDCPVVR